MKTMKFSSALLLSFLLLAVSASCTPGLTAPTPTDLPVLTLDALNFRDAATKAQFTALNRCIEEMVDASWTAVPARLSGNFYKLNWCQGSGAASDCRIAGAAADRRDQHVLSLYTLFYPQDQTTVFGLGLEALWVPAETGWRAIFSFSENGEGIVGDHWGVRFDRYPDPGEQAASTTVLESNAQYQVQKTPVDYSFDLPLRDDLALYLKSAEAMRARRLEQLQALAQKVKMTITAHQAAACEYGPAKGSGIPPECTPRPLTAEEEAQELARAEAYFADQTQIMNENYTDLYAAWMKAFPMDRCWR